MSRGTLDSTCCLPVSHTRLSLSMAGFPKTILLPSMLTLLWSITPLYFYNGLGSFPFARHYLGNRCFFRERNLFSFFSSGYLDVSVHRVPPAYLWIQYTVTKVCLAGFPHSEIHGSMDICSSPWLIAAYHVFHRLLVPRHPPCALFCLT